MEKFLYFRSDNQIICIHPDTSIELKLSEKTKLLIQLISGYYFNIASRNKSDIITGSVNHIVIPDEGAAQIVLREVTEDIYKFLLSKKRGLDIERTINKRIQRNM